jgi:hypothetical protein
VPKDPLAPSFDPARSVTFDLEQGHVELADGGAHVLVPADALSALLAGESSARVFGRTIGAAAMERVGFRVADAHGSSARDAHLVRDTLRAASIDTVVELLGGELALLGLGSLRIEQWGRTMLFVLYPHALDERADELVCGVFEGALVSLTDRDVAALVLDRSGSQLRILIGNHEAIERAGALLAGASFFTTIVSALQDERENA